MRFLFVYRFCGLGGVETSMLNRIAALELIGVEAQLLFSEFYGEGGKSIARHPAVRVGLPKRDVLDLLRQRFDLIFVVDYPEFLDVIHEAHVSSKVLLESHASFLPALPRFYSKLNSSRVRAVVVPAEFNKRLIRESGTTTKQVFVVPNAVDTGVFHRRPQATFRDHFGARLDAPVVIWVGRLEDEKNPHEFLLIAQELLQRRPALQFVLVGDTFNYDEYREMLGRHVTPENADRIHFLRGIEYTRMPDLYSLAAATGGCLVSTSRHESQPMTFIEAMACECPVVSTDVGGVRELVSDRVTGRLYELGNIPDAVTAIDAMIDPLDQAGRAAIVSTALALVRTRHSLEAIGKTYTALLKELIPTASAQPLVSAIIIFLNGENFLAEAIRSVVHQTYDRWELLLVDDGSTDRSTSIARDHAVQHPGRIRYLEHEGHRNRGKSASRNLGLRHASGKYIALLDHDDVWLASKLEDQVAILEARPEAGMMYGRTRYWHSWTGKPGDQERDGFTTLGVPPDTLINPPHLLTLFLRDERSIASACSVLIRRDLANRVGGFEESFANIYDDVVFLAKLYLEAPVFVADACWDSYRQHPDNSTSIAFRTGQWHPRRPNPRREQLLTWLEGYVLARGITDAELLSCLEAQLQPYRQVEVRTTRGRFYETCLDAGLAVLRGEDARPLLDAMGDTDDPGLDPQEIAEQIFDAMPRTTETAPNRWLDIWPAPKQRTMAFLGALEARSGASGIAHQAMSLLEQLIEGKWWLRVADGNLARLALRADQPDQVRVVIAKVTTTASYDIQLNKARANVRANQHLVVTFRARADQARTICFGVAQSHAPWINLGLHREVELSTVWQDFEADFVVTENDDNARIHFDLGESDASVDLAAVRMFDPAEKLPVLRP